MDFIISWAEFLKTQKQIGALSCFKSRERRKGDSLTFDLKRARKDKHLGDILYLGSQKYQNDYLG